MGASSWVHLDVLLVKKVTDQAALLVIDGHDEECWIPLSQMEDDSIEEGDENLTVSVTEWIAKQKGIET